MSSAWEVSAEALKFVLAGVTYTFRGPNHPDSVNQDATEPYVWFTGQDAIHQAFTSAYVAASTTERNAIQLIISDGLSAPTFTDDTGDDITGTVGTAIANVTVPEAEWRAPAPTYAVVGSSLPAGIAFNTTSRVLSGTPTAAGTGTITIRATNSEGSDDWTVAYEFESGVLFPYGAVDIAKASYGTVDIARISLGDTTIV